MGTFTAAQSLCYITEVSFIVHTMLIASYVTKLCSKSEMRHSDVSREKNLEIKCSSFPMLSDSSSNDLVSF